MFFASQTENGTCAAAQSQAHASIRWPAKPQRLGRSPVRVALPSGEGALKYNRSGVHSSPEVVLEGAVAPVSPTAASSLCRGGVHFMQMAEELARSEDA